MDKKRDDKKRRNYFSGSGSDLNRGIGNNEAKERYFIITEGETEYYYFHAIKNKINKEFRGLVELEPQQSKKSNIAKIMSIAEEKARISHLPYTKIFPVFDRDSKSNPEDIFNSAIRNPPSKKIKSLYTNPCFEYWLFLHLEDSQSLSCDNYLKALSKIFKLEYKKTDPGNLDRILKKKPNGILAAIRRAEQIDQSSDLNLLQSKRIPSTNMPEFFDKIADALYQPKDSDKYLPDKKLREEKLKVFLFQV